MLEAVTYDTSAGASLSQELAELEQQVAALEQELCPARRISNPSRCLPLLHCHHHQTDRQSVLGSLTFPIET